MGYLHSAFIACLGLLSRCSMGSLAERNMPISQLHCALFTLDLESILMTHRPLVTLQGHSRR
jgi:hypothetical protein